VSRSEANLSAERAVIAWYLYLRHAHPRSSPLRPEHFAADPRHREWWRRALECQWDDTSAEHALGVALDDLAECDRASHPTASTIPGYEHAIINSWCERHLAAACGGALDGYKRGDVTLAEMLAIVREAIGDVEAGSLRRSKTYRELGEKVLLDWASAVLHGKEKRRKIPMPWYPVQCCYGGWTRTKVHVIGGLTSHHKTTALRQSLQHAGHHRFRGLLCTLEDTGEEMAARGIASASPLDTRSLADGTLPQGYTIADGERLTREAQIHLANAEGEHYRINDRGKVTLSQLVGIIRAEAAQGLDIVGIDHGQLIFRDGRGDRDAQFWALVTATLAALAKELDIAIIVTCQIDKVGVRTVIGSHRPPRMSDIQFASTWIDDAWFVAMIYVVEERDGDKLARTGEVIFSVQKCKDGPVGDHELRVFPQHDRIEG
jgi:replicative DNA helicase